jgi:hypothetical protein
MDVYSSCIHNCPKLETNVFHWLKVWTLVHPFNRILSHRRLLKQTKTHANIKYVSLRKNTRPQILYVLWFYLYEIWGEEQIGAGQGVKWSKGWTTRSSRQEGCGTILPFHCGGGHMTPHLSEATELIADFIC